MKIVTQKTIDTALNAGFTCVHQFTDQEGVQFVSFEKNDQVVVTFRKKNSRLYRTSLDFNLEGTPYDVSDFFPTGRLSQLDIQDGLIYMTISNVWN